MKKIAAALVASALAAFALVAPTSSATALDLPKATPTPYIEVCDIQVSPARVRPGQTFTATVTADKPTTITATYEGQTASKSGTTELVATFTAPASSATRTTQVRAVCGDKEGAIAEVVVVVDGDGDGDGDGGSDGDADADGGSDGDADADGGSDGDADADGGSDGDADVDGGNAGGVDVAGDADVDGGDANGILPGTGGTESWLLILGLLLLLAGTGAALHRRRHV